MRWWHIAQLHPLEVALFGATAWSEAGFWSELAAPCREYFVVVEDATPAASIVAYGGISYEPNPGGVCDVQTIAVSTAHQGRGLGRHVLTHLIRRAEAREAGSVLLEVRSDNIVAQGLYQNFGFEQISVRRNYYGSDIDALILQLRPVRP